MPSNNAPENDVTDDPHLWFPRVDAWTATGAALAGVAAIVLYGSTAPYLWKSFTFAAVGLTVAGASFVVGGLVGFLFGIPRSSQKADSAGAGTPQPAQGAAMPQAGSAQGRSAGKFLYTPNTNLEEISDWLTKILVGVSLTQIPAIFGFVNDVGNAVAVTYGQAPGAKPFAIALIIYFAVTGFIVGYLWTSLYLGKALTAAQQALVLKRLSDLELRTRADVEALRLTQVQLEQTGEAPKQEELDRAIAASSKEARAHIFYRAHLVYDQNWRDASGAPAVERTIPLFKALIASDREEDFHRNHALLGYALMHKPAPDWEGAKAALSKAIEIRDRKGEKNWRSYEANRAICLVSLDVAFKSGKSSDDDTKAAILADFKAAKSDSWVAGWLKEEPLLVQWATKNHALKDLDGASHQSPDVSG